ncbi:pyridine nucleotide-disulfide oxidoreductase family protein [Mycobacterium kansasii]|uniref:Pyridine nucleotide-disulfide oxidoreductase family protein n=1 Tax=Mycobacterium kansasii TaxID=1768 RepID=A0A1V3XUV2_MYCKA|nr:pyridine nucleotide-disulfide oxidoreductase family protein [Mycobacterium kansasii]
MRVVVMGCGRVGSSVADALSRIGHDVAVIDRDSTAFNRLSPEFAGERVLGQGFDRDVLLRAGIEDADAFAAVSSGDNSNIISARLARETFGVRRVVARIYDAKRAEVYERLGIPTIATVPWTTDRLLNALLRETETAKWRDPTGTVAVAEVILHEDWIGHRVTDLEQATGARAAFLIRFGTGCCPSRRRSCRPATRSTSPPSPAGRPRRWPLRPCRPVRTSSQGRANEARRRRRRRLGPASSRVKERRR